MQRDRERPLMAGNLAPRVVRRGLTVAICLLVASIVALAVAPLAMPHGYSWIAHTTSESAAQGVDGAWLARTGFLCFGAAVLTMVVVRVWPGVGRWFHGSFGTCLLTVAVFSSRPWMAGPYDPTEDLLHSVAATLMGFAFAGGVAVVAWKAVSSRPGVKVIDAVALVAAVAIPLAMVAWPSAAGMLQRAMFATAYLWYAMAALDHRRLVAR